MSFKVKVCYREEIKLVEIFDQRGSTWGSSCSVPSQVSLFHLFHRKYIFYWITDWFSYVIWAISLTEPQIKLGLQTKPTLSPAHPTPTPTPNVEFYLSIRSASYEALKTRLHVLPSDERCHHPCSARFGRRSWSCSCLQSEREQRENAYHMIY